MKKLFTLLLSITMVVLCLSCKKEKKETVPVAPGTVTIAGEQSPIGVVGTTVSSSSGVIAGVSSISISVTSLSNGVSTCTGSAIVTNQAIKNLLSNIPELTINGDTVSTNSVKFRSTTEGIESCSGPAPGIWVKYSSSVGDTYPIGSASNKRTVVSKSSTDDYYWGGMYIKVLKVEENPSYLKSTVVTKITYIANHKFGMVGIEVTFDDETTATFPFYASAQNE